MIPALILVVDDEPAMRRVLEIGLRQLGHTVHVACNGREALKVLNEHAIDLVLTDLRMPVLDGIGLLQAMADERMTVPTLVMTAQGSVDSAVQAMKLGAQDYLQRPVDMDVLELAVRRTLARERLRADNSYLKEQVQPRTEAFVGNSPAMAQVFEQIGQVGPTRATVFITGETGSGKEVAARAVHRASDRADRLFVAVNCAALPAEMIEAELFGHQKGAFTGAVKDRVGRFELADGGTLFLDEITEMPLALQPKLLRALQEGCIERLGNSQTVPVDVRIIAACNRDPREAVRQGLLREDLYYRLNVFHLRMPALRERREDILLLTQHLATRQRQRIDLAPEVQQRLQAYSWPGNVRELDNVLQRALILAGPPLRGVVQIRPEHLPADLGKVTASAPDAQELSASNALPTSALALSDLASLELAEAIVALESNFIEEALRRSGDNKRRAAALLGISERALWYKLGRSRGGSALD